MKFVITTSGHPVLTLSQCGDGTIDARVETDGLTSDVVMEYLINGLFALAEKYGTSYDSTITLNVKDDN